MNRVDEELAAAAIGRSRVRHRERARLIRDLRVVRELVLDRAVRPVPGARGRAAGIGAIRAAELEHEALDHPVKVESVVEAALRKLDEVAGGDGHAVAEELDRHVAQGGLESRCRICPPWRLPQNQSHLTGNFACPKSTIDHLLDNP